MLKSAAQTVIEGAFWLIAGAVAIVVLSLVIALCVLPLPAGPFGALAILVVTAVTVRRLRWQRGAAVLHYLAQCVRLNLPLPRMLSAAQRGEGRVLRRRLAQLSAGLATELPVDEALHRHVPEVPSRTIAMIRAASHTGQLPGALDRLLAEHRHATRRDQSGDTTTYVYLVLVMLATLGVIGGMSVFVAPMYREIFADFDAELPRATLVLFGQLRLEATGWALLAIVTLAAISLAGWCLWTILHGFLRKSELESHVVDPVLWRLPVIGPLVRDRGLADACDVLGRSLAAGLPMERALDEAAALRINVVLRKRLARFAEALRGGRAMGEAAAHARMPGMMRGLLGTMVAGGDAEPVFAFLHRYYAGRDERRRAIVRSIVGPVIVLALAVVVGFIAYALLLPVAELIWASVHHVDGGL